MNLLAGIRYASLDQRLDVGGPTQLDVQNIHSQINFEGGGLRVGFEAQRRTPLGLVFYGRTTASVVAGTFHCAYTQSSANNGVEAESGFPADRVVPMLDAELGIGLSLFNDKLRLTSGYSFSGWFNVVRSDEFIGAVQTNNFSGMSNTLTFDGFVSRVELQFYANERHLPGHRSLAPRVLGGLRQHLDRDARLRPIGRGVGRLRPGAY